MAEEGLGKFGFDALQALVSFNYESYCRERQRLIKQCIDDRQLASEDELCELQNEIDGQRAVTGAPKTALTAIWGMLNDNLDALMAQLDRLQDESGASERLLGETEVALLALKARVESLMASSSILSADEMAGPKGRS